MYIIAHRTTDASLQIVPSFRLGPFHFLNIILLKVKTSIKASISSPNPITPVFSGKPEPKQNFGKEKGRELGSHPSKPGLNDYIFLTE
jgi:hypothetical protein